MTQSDMNDAKVVCFVTTPPARASAIARTIVERKLAACVNIVPRVDSIYWWDGAVVEDAESLLVVKTTAARVSALNEALREIHPYETFELLSLRIDGGNPLYLDWIGSSVE